MDGQRFDEMTRALGRAGTRRGVLRGLAAGLAGIALAGRVGGVVAARKPLGSVCARATECTSFFCVDGVCCDDPCTGQCEACTALGACAPVIGAPVGNRPACSGSGVCATTCDGQTTSSCASSPGPETQCGAASCAAGWQTTYACGGNGTCVPAATSCGHFACNAQGTACLTSCATNDDCVGAAHCGASGICQGDAGLGQSCEEAGDCQFGHCSDGVCCDQACDSLCTSCTVASSVGSCTPLADGTSCGGGKSCDNGDCACSAGLTDCEVACADTQSDPAHCGACGNACDEGETCCGGVCFDTDSDVLNCGGCGVHCRVSELCSTGECVCPGFPTCGTGSGICCKQQPNAFSCLCVPGGNGTVDPLTCDLGSGCPAGTTLCPGPTGSCGSGANRSCCPAGTTCDTATGTCFL